MTPTTATIDRMAVALGAAGVLRLTTCGAVDDGKSTLLGRLLIDAGAVFEDHWAALLAGNATGAKSAQVDAALLFDGLEAEREQGITIDVAYRYFMTARRKFIIADAPGHIAHTRNLATAASNADVAVLVVDAARGIRPQTQRHARIAALVGVRHAIIVVNKMDQVGHRKEAFDALAAALKSHCDECGLIVAATIPVVARDGDNIVNRSAAMAWHEGPTLLSALEDIDIASPTSAADFRMPVQLVTRSPDAPLTRGYAGTISAGRVRTGETVELPHATARARVQRIMTANGDLEHAQAGDAVTLFLDGEHDVSRGDLICAAGAAAPLASRLTADLLCLSETGLERGRRYEFRCAARAETAVVDAMAPALVFEDDTGPALEGRLLLNEIARCEVSLSRPLPIDRFETHPATGAFLLVDRQSGDTVAAGMVREAQATNVRPHRGTVTRDARSAALGHRPAALWFTGLSGAGKSTIATLVEMRLHLRGAHTFALDGDNLRCGLTKDLGFSDNDRVENIRRAAEVARLMVDAGLIVTCAFISPFRADREMAGEIVGREAFVEIFVDASLETCVERDPKGLYRKAFAGQIKDFTGVDSPYEAPIAPGLRLDTQAASADALADDVVAALIQRGVIG